MSDTGRRMVVSGSRLLQNEPRQFQVRPAAVLAALGLFVFALLYVSVTVLPRYIQPLPPVSTPAKGGKVTADAKTLFDEQMARVTAQNTVRTTLVQALAALLVLTGAGIGGYFTLQQIRVSREGQLTDRFAKAVEQLADDKKHDLRIGGIYALGRLAINSPFDRHAIAEVLVAFVRRRVPVGAAMGDQGEEQAAARKAERIEMPAIGTQTRAKDQPLSIRADDVQAALTVLGEAGFNDVVLPYIDAHGATLPGASFPHAVFEGANLAGSYLVGVDLRGAILRGAELWDADLREADLRGAKLQGAQLQGAMLQGAKLQGAALQEADLHGAWVDTRTRWPDEFEANAHELRASTEMSA